MENQFVTYEIAKQLKELGFDEPCLAYFHIKTNKFYLSEIGEQLIACKSSLLAGCFISAPLWQQAIDWFREKHNIQILESCPIPIEAIRVSNGLLNDKEGFCFYLYSDKWNPKVNSCNIYNKNRYEAREKAILKAIELCGNKDTNIT